MNEFNFRVANAAPRASVFEIGQNVGDTKTTYIYSYKTKYINGKSTGQKTNVDWDMESSIPSWVSVKYAFEGNDCKVTFTTLTINWPLNTFSGAFFKEGQTPQIGSTGTAYFNFSVLDDTSVHKYKKSEGVRVNLRDGNTEIAYPGDRISAYRFTNQTWQLRSTFLLPSSDQIITL